MSVKNVDANLFKSAVRAITKYGPERITHLGGEEIKAILKPYHNAIGTIEQNPKGFANYLGTIPVKSAADCVGKILPDFVISKIFPHMPVKIVAQITESLDEELRISWTTSFGMIQSNNQWTANIYSAMKVKNTNSFLSLTRPSEVKGILIKMPDKKISKFLSKYPDNCYYSSLIFDLPNERIKKIYGALSPEMLGMMILSYDPGEQEIGYLENIEDPWLKFKEKLDKDNIPYILDPNDEEKRKTEFANETKANEKAKKSVWKSMSGY